MAHGEDFKGAFVWAAEQGRSQDFVQRGRGAVNTLDGEIVLWGLLSMIQCHF